MTAAQTSAKIRQNLADLRANRERELQIIGADLSTLIKLRIQGSGEDYLNTKFRPYNVEYAKERTKAGFQTRYVDYTRTGRMWASVYPDVDGNASVYTVVITAHGDDNTKKVKSAVLHKRGNILRPSQEELDLAEEANNQRVLKYLQI